MNFPNIGLGTFRLKGEVVKQSVQDALDIGYRAIDTAQIYDNELEIGQVLQKNSIARDELFLTTKVWVDHFTPEKFIPSLKNSLTRLQVDQVDLTLLHWPAPKMNIDLKTTLELLAEAQNLGLTQHIGVSNFNIQQVQYAIDLLGKARIFTNQIELSPYLQNRTLVSFLKQNNIAITSYMTLAYGKVLHDPTLKHIANVYHVSVAQVVLAWALHHHFHVIPSSTNQAHLISNLEAQQLVLSPEHLAMIDGLERNSREINPEQLAPQWDI